MTSIYLVRHGQASFGKKDYDNLSEIGKKQSFLLGKHFKKLKLNFRVVNNIFTERHHSFTSKGCFPPNKGTIS